MERRHSDQHCSYDGVVYRQKNKGVPHRLPARINRKLLVRESRAIRKNSSENIIDQVIFEQVLMAADKRQENVLGGTIIPIRELFLTGLGRPSQSEHKILVAFQKTGSCVVRSDAGDNQL